MNLHRFLHSAVLIMISLLLALNPGLQPRPIASVTAPSAGSGQTQTIGAGAVPAGLTAAAWRAILAQIEPDYYDIQLAAQGGYQAVNRSLDWHVAYGDRGPQVTPRTGADWRWGLSLIGYGYADEAASGLENLIGLVPRLQADQATLTYQWDSNLSEWWVNTAAGLEQGFTLQQRPIGQAQARPLQIEMAVAGTLSPVQQGNAIAFQDERGASLLTYAKLSVTDANGQVIPSRLSLSPAGQAGRLRITVADAAARYPLTIDPLVQRAYLKASNTGAGDNFGWAVAVSGDTVVVGAYSEDSNATGVNGNQSDNSALTAGAAYVFVYSAGSWSQQAYLKASNTDATDNFGRAVAVSGDTIVIGASYEDSNATGVNGIQTDNSALSAGAAYVFTRSGTTWSQQAYLKASNTEAGDSFGRSVAVSGDTVVIGAVNEDSGVVGSQSDNSASSAGAVYIFTRSGSTWSQQAYLKASNPETNDYLGASVAVTDDTVVIGATGEDSNATGVNGNQSDNSATDAGAAYVFLRSGSTWSQQAYLKASNAEIWDLFGISAAVSGNTIVVGAYQEGSNATGVNGNQSDNTATNAGAAYAFIRSGTVWSQQAYLKASNTGASDYFGTSVALSGDTLVVGANGEDSNATGVNGTQSDNSTTYAGAAYLFTRSGTTWSQQNYLKASNTGASDYFGISLAVSGDTVVISARSEDSNATGVNGDQSDNSAADAGAVYVFGPSLDDWGDLPAPYATTLANNGARHVIVAGAPSLGSVAPEGEIDGQPDANASGDDNNLAPDDEEGVTRSSGVGRTDGGWTNGTVTGGQGGAVNVTISTASACLGAFLDFNSSGTLSAAVLRDSSGAVVSQPLAVGTYTFYFDVPAGTFPVSGPNVPIYSRFRVTSPVGGVCAGSAAYSSTGSAADGEVEDYRMNFTPTAIELMGLKASPVRTVPAGWLMVSGLILASGGFALWRRRR